MHDDDHGPEALRLTMIVAIVVVGAFFGACMLDPKNRADLAAALLSLG